MPSTLSRFIYNLYLLYLLADQALSTWKILKYSKALCLALVYKAKCKCVHIKTNVTLRPVKRLLNVYIYSVHMIEYNQKYTFLPDLMLLGTFFVANCLHVSLTGMLNLSMHSC